MVSDADDRAKLADTEHLEPADEGDVVTAPILPDSDSAHPVPGVISG